MDFLSALRAHQAVEALLAKGQTLAQAFAEQPQLRDAYNAWIGAPVLGPIHFVADLPALLITVLTTALIYVGIKESRNVNNVIVALKLIVIVAVIAVGFFYVTPANWSPFAPNGLTGVMAGVAAVFWAFIGFDAISTTAEECENPRRDVPKAIFSALIICTVLYVLISFVLTGIVSYRELNVGDPLAYIFKDRLPWLSGVIALQRHLYHRQRFPRVSARPAAHLDEHEPRRIAATDLFAHSPEISDTVICNHHHGIAGRNPCVVSEPERGDRTEQHRNLVCVRARLRRCSGAREFKKSSGTATIQDTLYQRTLFHSAVVCRRGDRRASLF